MSDKPEDKNGLNFVPLLGNEGPFGEGRDKFQPVDIKDHLDSQVEGGKISGTPALVHAAAFGHTKMVEDTLAKGVDINAKSRFAHSPKEITALMSAAAYCHSEVLELLISRGANVNETDADGWTALMSGVSSECIEPCDRIRVVEILLASGADVNAKANDGYTALMHAARNGSAAIVRALLGKGAEVNVKDDNGATALIHAIASWDDYGYGEIDADVVRLLLEKGADVSTKDDTGRTALMYAEEYEQTHIVEQLRQGEV